MIIFGIIFLIVGISMILFPNKYFSLIKWKFEGKSSPSKAFKFHMMIGGISFIVAGLLVCLLSPFA